MSRKYFGTDGVRGQVGRDPMTVDFALRLASAAARVLAPEGGTVLIGKDTRLSGYMFEAALEAGFVAAGVDVMLIGPLPTPGIAYMTQRFRCDFGVVISASHNLYDDNGIKFFDASGAKLSDELEARDRAASRRTGAHARIARSRSRHARRQSRAPTTRISARASFPARNGLVRLQDRDRLRQRRRIQGRAACAGRPRMRKSFPSAARRTGATSTMAAVPRRPSCCNSRCPASARNAGIALDGDGDRLVMVDHLGRIVDGDQLLYVIARARAARGRLRGPVVGTVMSNLGLELALQGARHRVPARAGRRPLRAGPAARDRRHSRWRDLRPPAVPGQDHYRRRPDQRVAGSRDHEADGPQPRRAHRGHDAFPQVLLNVKVERRFDPDASVAVQEAVRAIEAELKDRRTRGIARLGHRAGHSRDARGPRRGDDPLPCRTLCAGRARCSGLARGGVRPHWVRPSLLSPSPPLNIARLFSTTHPFRGPVGEREAGVAMRRPLVAGNWKMHGSRAEAAALLDELIQQQGATRCGRSGGLSPVRLPAGSGAAPQGKQHRARCARTCAPKPSVRSPARCRPRCSRTSVAAT